MSTAPTPPDNSAWVAEQVAKFTPDDLRRAAEVFKAIVADLDPATGAA